MSQGTWAQLKPGVVVESLEKNFAGEKARLQEGDILFTWSRAGAKGEITSPFELSLAEIEQAPQGNVTLEGVRGTEKHVWQIGPDGWGIKTRPNFSQNLLSAYRDAQQSANAGKLDEAVKSWQEALQQAKDLQPAWLHAWFLFRAAETFAEAQQWRQADAMYGEAAKAETGPVIKSQIFRGWATSFQRRNDWSNAEKYLQLAIAESHKLGAETVSIATDISSLGNMASTLGDLGKAEEYHTQALAIREKSAPGSLAVAASLNNLSKVATDRGDLAKAENYAQQALAIEEKAAPGGLGSADSLHRLGTVAYRRGDLTKAEQYFRGGEAIREKLAPDSLALAWSFQALGNVVRDHGDLAKSEEYYNQSLTIRQKVAPGSMDAAASFNSLGLVSWTRGNLKEAEDYISQALAIQQKLAPGSMDIVYTVFNLGGLAWEHGDLAKAERMYRQGMEMLNKLGASGVAIANAFSSLGLVALYQGDLDKTEEYYSKAQAIMERLSPNSLDYAMTLNSLGVVAEHRGDLAKAEEYQLKALAIREKVSPEGPDVAMSLNNLGDIALARQDRAKAESYYRQSVSIREKTVPESVEMTESLRRLADSVREAGDLDSAEKLYRQAIAIAEKLAPERTVHAEALAGLASIMRRKQQPEAAAQLFARALEVLESHTARLGGSKEVQAGFRARYEGYYKDYMDLLITQKQPELALQVLERLRARSLLEMLVQGHINIQAGVDARLLSQEAFLQADFRAKSERRIRLLGDKQKEQSLAALNQEIKKLLLDSEEVARQIRVNSPGYAALTQPQPLSAREIQELLDSDTVLLEYSLGEERSHVFALTSNSLHAYELPKRAAIEESARKLYQLLRTWRNPTAEVARGNVPARSDATKSGLSRETRLRQTAAALSQMILSPVASELPSRRLLIVSDGVLQYIPFSVLPEPKEHGSTAHAKWLPLIAEHELLNLPSASVLAILRQQAMARKRPDKMVAVLADPVFNKEDERITGVKPGKSAQTIRSESEAPSSDSTATEKGELLDRWTRSWGNTYGQTSRAGFLARLPYTRQEAQSILAMTPRGAGMKALDFDASRATAMDPKLAQYRIIHFATHSYSDGEHPELSALVFSMFDQRGNAQDGLVGLQDIYNLNLPADLVVLSACETGLGKEIKGEGLMGLTRGFMYAGATRVVASLWKVDDVATAELMQRFYTAMEREKMRPAAALQRAQVEMWRQQRWRDPYYWAGFELQGEWK